MTATAPKLRILPPPKAQPRDLAAENRQLRRDMAEAKRDLSLGVEACIGAAFSGSRAHLINELHRLGLRVERMSGKEAPRPLRSA